MAPKPPPIKFEEKSNEKEIEKIINKGGGGIEENQNSSEETKVDPWTLITVRLPKVLLKDIDDEVAGRFGLSRNAWILEAFQGKLKKNSE